VRQKIVVPRGTIAALFDFERGIGYCGGVERTKEACDWLDGILHPKKRAFLVAFAGCGQVTESCKQADIDRMTDWNWRQDDPDYCVARAKAWAMACEALEAEAYRRGHGGVDEPVFHGGSQVGTIRKYSDTLLMFLMKGANPNTYRDTWRGELSGPGGGPIRTAVDLSKLTEEQLATLAGIASAASGSDADRG
jgi:hypothetical protein